MSPNNLDILTKILELTCSCNVLIITCISGIIGVLAYRAQVKSILITQWTTFKILLQDQEAAYTSFLFQKTSDNDVDESIREEALKKIRDRKAELNKEIYELERQLGLVKENKKKKREM
jgi:hypothetical protein